MKIEIGSHFGKWTVLEKDKNKYGYSICQCMCGTIRSVRNHCLTHDLSLSCGKCINKSYKKGNVYDLTQDYGIGYTTNTNHPFLFDKEDYDLIKNYSWREDGRGYIVTTLNNYLKSGHNRTLQLHQLVKGVELSSKFDKLKVIDHKNLNKADNQKNNLIITTQQNNVINRRVQKNNTTGATGVYIIGNSYRGCIVFNGKQYSKGFPTMEQAIEWRKEQEKILFAGVYRQIDCEENNNE